MMRIAKVPSARSAGYLGSHFSAQEEYGLPSHLSGRKLSRKCKPTQRVMSTSRLIKLCWQQREHCKRDQSYNRFRKQEDERMKNQTAIKSLIRCTHFLAPQHIAHTTNFDKLVDLVASCGSEDLKYFQGRMPHTHFI